MSASTLSRWTRLFAALGLACGASAVLRWSRFDASAPLPDRLARIEDPLQQRLYG